MNGYRTSVGEETLASTSEVPVINFDRTWIVSRSVVDG